MPFLPNNPNALNAAAEDVDQTELDSVHLDIILAAARGDGVLTGCAVSAQGTPDMTVAVASGTVQINGTSVAVTSGNLTIGANAETWQRYDLIAVNSAGTKSVVSGAAYANITNQVFPPIPANSVVLAAVRVLPSASAITVGKITDVRAIVRAASGGGGSSIGAPGLLYVAATDASAGEKAIADYQCDGTADNVEIQAAISAAAAAGVGTVLLSTGSFALAAELNLLGGNDVDVESWAQLVGQGPTRTRLIAGSGLTGAIKLAEVWKGRLARFTVEVVGGTHGVRSVATNTGTAGYRSFWGSTVEDVQVIGPWDTTHTGWAFHLESPFRSTFRNLEVGGVGNGVRLFSSNDNFNPGDCTFERVFCDLSGNTKTAYSVESTAAAGNMNQVVFTMVEAIASGTGCTGIYLGGSGGTPGPVNHTEWFGVNLEQFDTLVNIDRGQGNVVSCNYVETRGANGLTAFKFGANAYNNRISRAGMVYSANTLTLVNDGNTALPAQPNVVEHVKVYADTGSTVSVTLNTAKTTVLRGIVGDGSGTFAANVRSAPVGRESQVIDVKRDFGATGDGTTDDATAIQAAIDAAISSGAYASVTRTGLATVFFPPGTYRVNTPLRVRSVIDFHMRGSGAASKLRAGASGMECILDLNGVAYSSFKDFAFTGDTGFSATRALWLRWNGTNRSTAWNEFQNLLVRDLAYTRAAFEMGDTGNTGVQVDTDTWVNCVAAGGRTAGGGDATNYQAGFQVGEGVSGNNLLHHFYGCTSNNNRWGIRNDSTQVAWFGGMLQMNDVDVYTAGRGYTTVKGVRSEGSLRLLETAGSASYPMSISLEDIDWHCNELHADQYFALIKAGGTVRFVNVHIPYLASKNPSVSANTPVDVTIIIDGVSSPTPWTWPFIDDTGGSGKPRVSVGGYAQVNSSGDVSAVQMPGAVNGLMVRMLDATPAGNAVEVVSAANTVAARAYVSNALSAFTLGSADADDAQNRVRGGSAGYYFDRQDGTQEWLIYRTGGPGGLYVRDVVNARMHVTYWPGASNAAANTEFASEVRILGPLNHDGTTVGFYGATPVTQPAANADTSGATLGDLETEVNQLKALLRSVGLMAP